jgi:GT2 family glycosyltransferase
MDDLGLAGLATGTAPRAGPAEVGAVVIGRNEGARLVACLASLRGRVGRLVYVDSGSTDGSVLAARDAGALVVELDLARPFTAARARNAGLAVLAAEDPPAYVQFVDGDCVLRDGWIETARAFLDVRPRAAVACGRRRERFPLASIYNRLCDWEWDTPVGPARACGGDALMRLEPLRTVGGFREGLIAGEEPELCLRLRRAGWEVWRLDAEMTWHDVAITRFGQWWRRARRAGHAFAEGAALHGAGPERHWVPETRRALAWGLGLPLLALGLGGFAPAGLLVLLAYPAQVLRLAVRSGPWRRASWERAFFLTLGRFPEMLGVLGFGLGRVFGRRAGLIEYK